MGLGMNLDPKKRQGQQGRMAKTGGWSPTACIYSVSQKSPHSIFLNNWKIKRFLTSCRQAAATICPVPLLPPWVSKRFAPPSRPQRSSSFPRPTRSHAHRCSRLTRQHGGEQSGLVTLTMTFWPWKWCPSHVWRGLPLCHFWFSCPIIIIIIIQGRYL